MSADLSSIFKTHGHLDPVADHAIYVHRPELDPLIRAARAPTVDAYLALLSSRQTGKTTLLYQLRARLQRRGVGCALIDLGVVKEQADAELYQFVASEILSELELQRLLRPRGPEAHRLPCNPIEFRSFLLETARQVQVPRLVLLIDEVEAVSAKRADGFFGTIRNIFSSRRKEDEAAFEKYLFVISGARELHRLSDGPNSPLNICERIYLQDLTLEGVGRIVTNFSRAAISAPPEAARWIYDETHGHPYLTQKLCAQIEQWHPGVITPEIVQRASVQLLKSDDHLEKMILQIDAEEVARPTLEQIVGGKSIPFSRLQPAIARLELLGAIRDAGQCAIRNPIYYTAFRTHFNLPAVSTPAPNWHRGVRLAVFCLALVFFLLNLPFLYNYVTDIHWNPRSVNDRFVTKALGSNFIIRYDPVLHANSPGKNEMTVDVDTMTPLREPVNVTFQSTKLDIALEGIPRRTIDTANQQIRFSFALNQSGLRAVRYNPFNPATDHRQVTLIFQPVNDDSRREVYTADFVVDYYSDLLISISVSLASFLAGIGAMVGNVGRVREIAKLVGKYVVQER